MTAADARHDSVAMARVIIPTVAGLAEVQNLLRTGPAEPNTVALQDFTRLPVSQEYDTFIRRPVGAIEQDFGHANWSLLLSARIDSGKSWQLGVYLAHAFEARGALWMAPPDGSDLPLQERMVIATGAIQKTGMVVQKVGQIPEKLAQALPRLLEARKAGQAALFLLPQANLADVPAEMAERFRQAGIDFRGVRTVADALHLLEIEAAAASGDGWEGNPWPGLLAYGADQRRVFFGRDRARKTALEQVLRLEARSINGHRRAFLLVHGPSGVGKSSFVRAGLQGDIVEMVTSGAPWQSVTVMFSGAMEPPRSQIAKVVVAALMADDTAALRTAAELEALPDHIAPLLSGAGCGSLLLVLDQFEQALVGLPPDQADALGIFIDRLCATGKVWVIATIRSGQLELVFKTPSLSALAADARLFRLEGPDREEIARIVTGPAEAAGISFEQLADGSDPVQTLVVEAARSTDSLPLLQLVLSRLFGYAQAGKIGAQNFMAMGGLAGAASTAADEAVARLRSEGIADSAIDRFLADLVRIDPETGEVLARTLAVPDQQESSATRIARHLTDTRLLVEFDDGDRPRLKLAHEALIEHWPRLKKLVVRLRAEILLRDEIEAETRKWMAEGKPTHRLRRSDAEVAAAKRLHDEGLLSLSADGREFVAQSAAASQRSRRNRWTVRIGGPVFVAVVSTIAAVYFSDLRNQANSALLEEKKRAVESAILLSRSEAASGRPIQGLQFLVDAVAALPEVDHPAGSADALSLALQKASRVQAMGTLPEETVFVQSGSEIWAYTKATRSLWLFGSNGLPTAVGGEVLRDGQLVDIRRLTQSEDIILVWSDGLVERRRFAKGIIGEGRSFQAPPDKTGIAVNMRHAGLDAEYGFNSVNVSWITPSGQVMVYRALAPVNEFEVVTDGVRIWVVDTETGEEVHPELPINQTYRIFDNEQGHAALMALPFTGGLPLEVMEPIFPSQTTTDVPPPADQGSERIRSWSAILPGLLQTAPQLLRRPQSDTDLAGLCRSGMDAESYGRMGRLLSDHHLGVTNCGSFGEGVLIMQEDLDGSVSSIWFRGSDGRSVDLFGALSQYFTDVSIHSGTELLRQYVTDATHGVVALLVHETLIVMRVQSALSNIPEVIGTLPFDGESPLISVLDAKTLLFVQPQTMAYEVRRLWTDTDASERLEQVSQLSDLALPVLDRLHLGDCVSLAATGGSQEDRQYNQFESGNAFSYECLAPGEGFQVFSGYAGMAVVPKEVGRDELNKEDLTDWITRKPTSPAYILKDGSVVAYHFEDRTIRRWRRTGSAAGWSEQVLLRMARPLIYMEPDATATTVLAVEAGEMGYTTNLIDLASGEAMYAFGSMDTVGATFLPDGLIIYAGEDEDGLTIHSYRPKSVSELLSAAMGRLTQLCGERGCAANSQTQ